MIFQLSTAGMHVSVFGMSAKNLNRDLHRAIELKNSVNKAVMKMGYDALGAFEAKGSHSWLSEMYACELTSKTLLDEVPWIHLRFIVSLGGVQLHKEQRFTAYRGLRLIICTVMYGM